MNELFNKEKIIYKNIDIPEELDFLIIKSINEGKKKNNYNIRNIGKILVASILTFFILLNIFPRVSILARGLPVIGKLAEFLTIDKGFKNAVEEGLIQDIGYEDKINGIKLKVSNLVGDYKTMWIEYEVEEGYNVEVDLTDISEENKISAFYGHSTEAKGKSGNYIKVNFENFQKEFLIIFNVYNTDKSEVLAKFKVPIKLEDKFNEELIEIPIKNNIIKTNIGDIEIIGINTSKTRTSLSFKLNSNDYNFVKFQNPVLIDSKGNEYKISSSYLNFDGSGNNNLEFEGEIKDNNITFKADNIFYDKKYDKSIIVDLNNKIAQDNEYNISLESYEDNILTLRAENVEGIQFKIEEDKYKFNKQSQHGYEEGNKFIPIEVITSLEILQEGDGIVEIQIDSIAKDNIEGFEFNIN
ncbi:MAG: DUF4179 domain-containing protein [Clostridium sartagoforme]|nr:DUF4179 domain-containing protein [Clostridium sartagoforme]